MVSVIGGTFIMGCTAEQDPPNCFADEVPTRSVTVTDFFIGKYEVTQAQWQAVWGVNNPAPFFTGCGGNCPMEQVSWFDAIAYCNKLSAQEGLTPCYYKDPSFTQKVGMNGNIWELTNDSIAVFWKTDANGYRLPTEAEWEYAARGGGLSMGYKYAGGNNLNTVAWYNANSSMTPHIVGLKPANELLLHDMSGNIQEWCYDWYKNSYAGLDECVPSGGGPDTARVTRGGHWQTNNPNFLRVALRNFRNPKIRDLTRGFRLARTP